MKHSRAFTLIELILVILLISILAVTVAPKFFGSESLSHITVRDQLVSLLRLSQLKAMNQLNTCNRVMITDDFMVIENNPDDGTCGVQAPIETRISLDGVSINEQGAATTYPFFIEFSEVGISDCVCTLNIVGDETVQLKIESQGYIHAL